MKLKTLAVASLAVAGLLARDRRAFDAFRNQLPPGVVTLPTFQGPRIQAGKNIGKFAVMNGSMWETAVIAGHSIGSVFVIGSMKPFTIIAVACCSVRPTGMNSASRLPPSSLSPMTPSAP